MKEQIEFKENESKECARDGDGKLILFPFFLHIQ